MFGGCKFLYLPALNKTSFSFIITSALPLPKSALSPGSGNTPFVLSLVYPRLTLSSF